AWLVRSTCDDEVRAPQPAVPAAAPGEFAVRADGAGPGGRADAGGPRCRGGGGSAAVRLPGRAAAGRPDLAAVRGGRRDRSGAGEHVGGPATPTTLEKDGRGGENACADIGKCPLIPDGDP